MLSHEYKLEYVSETIHDNIISEKSIKIIGKQWHFATINLGHLVLKSVYVVVDI